MSKITYNLAAERKVDARSFAFRATLLVLAAMLLIAVAFFNLARQRQRNRTEPSANGMIGRQISDRQRLSVLQAKEIDAWKKTWGKDLAAANRLIGRKSFSFRARLDFLESVFSPGIRIRHISLANESAGRISMAITAQSLKELFALYKKLAPYELVIANETQAAAEVQVNLNFRMPDEKI